MRISWNWLKTLVDTDLTPEAAAAVLTSTGLEVESVEKVEPVKGMLEGVVVGHVLSCTKHPSADRLTLCAVDLGNGEPARIVCGAPNVAEGQKVLVATVGTTLHMKDGGSLTIKKAKIRGEESNGMICAEDELGLGESHAGILVLDPSAITGTPAAQQLGLVSDHALEIGLTPNRSDAMSHLGVARDLVAALNYRTGSKLVLRAPSVEAFTVNDHALTIPVEVTSPHACPRYAGVALTQVKVAPSPPWLQDRLKSIGLKPINNVVDVTNYVQHELGQPLHAFDAARLRGGRVIVGHLPEGTTFTTLDGKERELSSDDLMIRDAEGGTCIAGVFGGIHSGVTEATTSIFLESACFDAASVRRTARRHGLNTDASFRFERGVDPANTVYALKRATLLLQEVTGAKVSSDIVDIVSRPIEPRRIQLDLAHAEKLIGRALEVDQVSSILSGLDFRITGPAGTVLELESPTYRVDVHRPVDVIEEILRIMGFDAVPAPPGMQVPAVRERGITTERLQRTFGDHFAARGFREILTPSLVNGATAVAHKAIDDAHAVKLKNPLSAELDTLRPTMLFGGLQVIAHNANRQRPDLRFFERGRTYEVVKGAVREHERTALWITGRAGRERWNATDANANSTLVKAEIEALAARCSIGPLSIEPSPHPLLHEAVDVRCDGHLLAVLGEVAPSVCAAFGLRQPVFHAELHDDAWLEALRASRPAFAELPRFPFVRRDLSLLVDDGVSFAQLEQAARKAERQLLRSVDLFDVYQGDKLPAGRKSYALSFILLDTERTLTDEAVDKAMERIRHAFEKELGAELRA